MSGTGPKYARRSDDNHSGLYNDLKDAIGEDAVQDVSRYPGLGYDLIARHIEGWPEFLEVKRPADPAPLTAAERKARDRWGNHWHEVKTLEEALAALGRLP
jgi:hypothetical protein